MRRTATLLALLGPLALAALAGCGAESESEQATPATSSPASASASSAASPAGDEVVVAVAEDDGEDARTAALTVGQSLSLDLATCGGCGFTWSVDTQPDSTVVSRQAGTAESAPAAAPASGPPVVGAPTTTRLAFAATGPGTTSVTVGYHPPTGDAAEREVVVAVTVTGEASALPAADSAATVVRDLYAKQAAGTLVQDATREQLAGSLTGELADLLVQDRDAAGGEVGALDKDPLYDAQDAEVSGLEVAPAVVQGRTASVVASFTNLGKATRVDVRLVPVAGAWRVSDVRYADGTMLATLLAG